MTLHVDPKRHFALLTALAVLAALVAGLLSVAPLAAEAPWATNVRVDDAPAGVGTWFPAIAVDPNGNTYAAWQDRRPGGSDDDVRFSFRPVRGAWGASVRVDDAPAGKDVWFPAIAVDPNGNATAVWQDWRDWDYSDQDEAMYFSYRPAGGTWSKNSRVDDAGGATQRGGPEVAVHHDGVAYAVWSDYRNGDADAYFSTRVPGDKWSANVRIDDAAAGVTTFPSGLAVDDDHNVHVVMQDNRSGTYGVWYTRRSASGRWSRNERVDAAAGEVFAGRPDVGVDAAHTVHVAWYDLRSGSYKIYASRRHAGTTTWTAAARVDDSPGSSTTQYPRLVVWPCGDALAAWADWRTGTQVRTSFYHAGGSWAASVRVDDGPGMAGGGYPYPELALGRNWLACAVWSDTRNEALDDVYSTCAGWAASYFLPLVMKNAN